MNEMDLSLHYSLRQKYMLLFFLNLINRLVDEINK